MIFTNEVKAEMEKKHITKSDLARATGYSYQHIYDLLAGQRRWNEVSMEKVCKALELEIKVIPKKRGAQNGQLLNDSREVATMTGK